MIESGMRARYCFFWNNLAVTHRIRMRTIIIVCHLFAEIHLIKCNSIFRICALEISVWHDYELHF